MASTENDGTIASMENSDTIELNDTTDVTSKGTPFVEKHTHVNPDISEFVPPGKLSVTAWSEYASRLPPTIRDHSLRVYIIARSLQVRMKHCDPPSQHEISLLFVACMFHDFGTISNTSPTTRFEIEGADAAVHFLSLHPEVSDKKSNEVWLAIALHTTPQTPERMGGIISLVRQAVMIDFKSEVMFERKDYFREWSEHFDMLLPRGPIEQELGDVVCGQALTHPKKAPKSTWAADLVRWKLGNPDAAGVNGAF